MPVRNVGAAVAVAALAIALIGCAEDCPLIRQNVVIVSPDADDLQPLVDACAAGQPAAGERCTPVPPTATASVGCGCLPLCRRILEIADQFSGIEAITECRFAPAPASSFGQNQSGAREVVVTYRPSSCPWPK